MKFVKRKLLAGLLAAAMIVPVLSGCGCKSDTKGDVGTAAGQTTQVVLNEVAHSLFYAPMYVANENG